MRFKSKPWERGGHRHARRPQREAVLSFTPAGTTMAELLGDVVRGSGSLYADSTLSWVEQQIEAAVAEAADAETQAHDLLEFAASRRRLVADLRHWLRRESGQPEVWPQDDAAGRAPEGFDEDAPLYGHWVPESERGEASARGAGTEATREFAPVGGER